MLENLRIPHYHWTLSREVYKPERLRCCQGENVRGAENQQERPDPNWIIGFVDGEGCFHVSINKLPGMTLGYQVLPEFRVVQHIRDKPILERLKEYFGFGSVGVNHGDRLEFRVRGLENLNRLIRFFREHPLKTSKQQNFEIFAEIIELMNQRQHLKQEGLGEIAILASQMNRKVKRDLESSETICQSG